MTTKNAIEAAKITKKLKNFTLDGEIVLHTLYRFEETAVLDSGRIQGFLKKEGTLCHTDKLMAGSMFGILPIFIIFLIFQKYIIDGMTAGAVKG